MTLRSGLVGFEPSCRRWRSWAVAEPVLAGMDSARLRAELAGGGQGRCDELLDALVRLARDDIDAQLVVVGCLWPGICARTARFARRADREDAVSLLVTELVADLASGRAVHHRRFVATELLERPTGVLRRAMRRERAWIDRGGRDGAKLEREPDGGEIVLSGRALLGLAVDAGVLSGRDAWLIYVTEVEDRSLRWAGRRLGIGYAAAIKRRQRAKAAWQAWWDPSREPGTESRWAS